MELVHYKYNLLFLLLLLTWAACDFNLLSIFYCPVEELRRHIRAVLDERRRMIHEGYNYEVCQYIETVL